MFEPITTISAIFALAKGAFNLVKWMTGKRKKESPTVTLKICDAEELMADQTENALVAIGKHNEWALIHVGNAFANRDCMSPCALLTNCPV